MMIRGIIATVFLIVLLNPSQLLAHTDRKKYFSRCLSSEPFMYLDRMSVQDCRNACAQRHHCLAVSYHSVTKICQLYDVITSLLLCVGFSVILKKDFPVGDVNTCSGVCPIADCKRIPTIDNAETFGNLVDIGAVVKVKCLNDDSVSYIKCQSNGQWTQLPTCPASVIYCGTPSSIQHADESHGSTSAGSIATYTCQSGYASFPADASMTVTCLDTGQWESISFTCQQIDCGTPAVIPDSQKAYSSTLTGSSVSYTCNSGFSKSPSDASMSVTCLDTGEWESISFTCQQVDCGTPPGVTNSQKTHSSTLTGSSVTYTCNSGYNSSPTSALMSITCLDTGQWESVSFRCQLIDCGTPMDVPNSQKTFGSTQAGASVTYTCKSGYIVSPSGATMSVICQQTGEWEAISFSCKVRSTITAGSSCVVDANCTDIDGRCLFTGSFSPRGQCYCKALYEFNKTLSICTQVCASYTSLKKYENEYLMWHKVGGSRVFDEAECLKFCQDNYGDTYLSVIHWYSRSSFTNCYCKGVTRQQVLDSSPEFLKSSGGVNVFTKTCD